MFLFCNVVLSVLSSFTVIWIRKRDLTLYLYCALAVLWLSEFCACSLWCLKLVSWSVIVAFPSHTHFPLGG